MEIKLNLAQGPRYLMRRAAVLDAANDFSSSDKYLELGYGTGFLTYEFYLKGLECYGIELSKNSAEIANDFFNKNRKIINFETEYKESWGKFDYIEFYEVLEHVEFDKEFLAEYRNLLNDNGRIIFSVPSHSKKYSFSDQNFGHFRRYDKKPLTELL